MRPGELGIALQHSRMEGPQRLARLEAELIDESPPHLLIRRERVGLAVGPIEGEHELRVQPLPERVLAREPLQVGDQVSGVTRRERRVKPILERGEPQLGQPPDLGSREVVVDELG